MSSPFFICDNIIYITVKHAAVLKYAITMRLIPLICHAGSGLLQYMSAEVDAAWYNLL